MNDQMSLEIRVNAKDDASPVIRHLMAEVRRLQTTIRKTFANPVGKLDFGLDGIKAAAANQRSESNRTANVVMRDLNRVSAFQSRMRRQAAREAAEVRRDDAAGYADAVRSLRNRMVLGSRLAAQQIRAQREVAREAAAAERERAQALRQRVRLDNWRFALRDRIQRREERDHQQERGRTIGHARDASRHGWDALTRSTRAAAATATGGAAATALLTRRSLGAEIDADRAEVATRQFGDLSKQAARELRSGWAEPLAEELGTTTARLLTSWTDAVKLGIPAAGAKAFAGLATKTSEAWGMSFEKVSDTFGTINTILTSKGEKFDIARIESVANTLQHLAAKQSTTPEKLVEFLSQGAGAAQVLGMSQEAAIAFGSASTSLGNKPGESGRLFDYIASRTIELPRLVKKKGDEGRLAKDLIRSLGYGSAQEMDARRRQSHDDFLPDLMQRFSRISDPKKKDDALAFFAGREWFGELGRIVAGFETYREADKLAREAKGLDAIGKVWELHREKLEFTAKQFRAGWLNILGEIGKSLTPFARQVGDAFLGWSQKLRGGGVRDRVKAVIEGFVGGLGFADVPALLRGVFGDPAKTDAGSITAWGDAARGFGDGLRSVGAAIKTAIGAISGPDASPETIGRLAGKIVGLSAALVLLSPVIGTLGLLISAVTALAGVLRGVAALTGLFAAGSAGAGAAAGVAGAGSAGILARLGLSGIGTRLLTGIGLGIVAEIGANRGVLSTALLDAIKAFVGAVVADVRKALSLKSIVRELTPAPIERWLNQPEPPKRDISPEGTRKVIESLQSEIERLNETLKKSEESLSGSAGSDKLKGSAGEDRLAGEVRRLVQSTTTRMQLAALTSGGSGIGSGGVGGSAIPGAGASVPGVGGILNARPGERLGPTTLGRRGIIGGGGVTSPMLRGEADKNAKEAYDFFRSKGLSHEAASGILASMHKESGFNPGARGDGGRAHGLFQHHPDRRAAIQRATGIDMSNATVRQQLEGAWWEMNHGDAGAQRALRILRQQGITAREAGGAFVQHFERPKRDERAERGALAEGFAQRYGNGGTAEPGVGSGQYGGLRLKGAQATAGGAAHRGVTDLMRAVQGDLPGAVKHFAAVNDRYHAGTGSKHAAGLAFDTSLLDPSKSREAAEAIRNRLRAAGLKEGEFRVIDEYLNPSRRSTGGHIHTQFNSADAAAKYARYLESLKGPAVAAAEATKDAADSVSGSGITKSAGANRLSDLVHRYDVTKPKHLNDPGVISDLVKRYGPGQNLRTNRIENVPMRTNPDDLAGAVRDQAVAKGEAQRAMIQGGSGGKSMTVQAPITIQGISSPEAVANKTARHIQDSTLWRTHDSDFQSA